MIWADTEPSKAARDRPLLSGTDDDQVCSDAISILDDRTNRRSFRYSLLDRQPTGN